MTRFTLISHVGIIALLSSVPSTDGFSLPAFMGRNAITPSLPSSSSSSTSLEMGKSQTMPGPTGKAKSGPSTSEYRQKKMNDRLKKKKSKKSGGFGGSDDEAAATAATKSSPIMEIELVATPEGGADVTPLSGGASGDEQSLNDEFVVRVKDMGPVEDNDAAKEYGASIGATVHNFWLTALAPGDAISKTRIIVLKDASKNAQFPGFRKGQIPPYAQPKMTNFALREVIVSSCQDALVKFGVKCLDKEAGELGDIIFNEDVDDISKKYDIKTCPSVPYTANFMGIFDPDAVREAVEDAEESAPETTSVVEE